MRGHVVEIICTQSSTATPFQRKFSKISLPILSITYSVIFIHTMQIIKTNRFESLPMQHQSKLTHLTDAGAPF